MMVIKPRTWNRSLKVSCLLSALLLVAFAPPTRAVPFIDSGYGSQAAYYLPEINAMGGTGVALYRGGLSNVFNPAFLSWEESQRLDFSVSFELETEERYVSLFDSFESRVTDTVIASNRHDFFNTGFAYAQRLGSKSPVTLGFSLTDRYSFEYQFEEEVRNPVGSDPPPDRDRILSERAYDVNGILRFLSLGAAVDVSRVLAFGAAVHYGFGTRELIVRQRDLVDSELSLYEKEKFSLDGVNFTLGGRWRVSDRVELGVAWETPMVASGNLFHEITYGVAPDSMQTESGSGRVDYPNIIHGGITYRPRNNPRTVFTMDAVFSNWSDLKDSRVPNDNPELLDTWDWRVGLQHTFYNNMPVRFGFRRLDSYLDREASYTFFTAGLGMPFARGSFDFSFELGKIVSEQEHLFLYPEFVDDYGTSFTYPEIARVEDTRLRFGIGYSLSW